MQRTESQPGYEADEKNTIEGFVWPMFPPNSVQIAKKTKYGFEIVLPSYVSHQEIEDHSASKSEIQADGKGVPFSQEETGSETTRQSQIDFDELDRLFNKVNSFNGNLTTKYSRYHEFQEPSSLCKRPPRGLSKQPSRPSGRGRGRYARVESKRVIPTNNSSNSKVSNDCCELEENSVNNHRTNRTSRTNQIGSRSRPLKAGIANSTSRLPRTTTAKGTSGNPKRSPPKTSNQDVEVKRIQPNREWILVEFLRQLILEDKFSGDLMRSFSELELDIAYRVLRMRYNGAEYFRFPSRTKNINAHNNKCNMKFTNEKKLLGEIWIWVIDEIKNRKHLWKKDKEEAILELFKIFHKPEYLQGVRNEVNDPAIIELINEGDEVVILNLFAEQCLDYPQ